MTRKSALTAEARLIADAIENRRRLKAKGRIAKLLAKRRGDLSRMPLSGKAALKAIKAGAWV